MREIFLTGCDENTEWQLPWFLENYQKHNEHPLVIADFGMSPEMRSQVSMYEIIEIQQDVKKGWFKKPRAILDATRLKGVSKVCWLDTDCEVKGDIGIIFDLSEKGKLGMVEDRPWTKRRGNLGEWFNSGVVLVEGTPSVLAEWAKACTNPGNQAGDQEVLHAMMEGNAILKMSYILPLPHTYNTLRLDYIDEIAVKDPKIVHHTGHKGKQAIRRMAGYA